MGTIVTIKGADFSKTGLGTVDNPNTGGTDADATAYFALVDGISEVEKTAINAMVKSLKNAGIWDKTAGIYPFLGTGQTSRGANLKDTAKNLTYIGYNASSENAKGWKGVAGMYAKTGISSNWNNDFTFIQIPVVWTTQNIVGVSNETLTSTLAIIRQDANATMSAGLGAANYQQFGVNALQGGFLATTNNGTADLYVNGTNKKTVAYSPISASTQLQIMAYQGGQAIAVNELLSIVCVGNSYLSTSEVADFNSIIDSFLTSIGRI